MRSRSLPRSTRGFSLIEVVAALVILALALMVFSESQGRSIQLVERARSVDYVTALAREKMTEVVALIERKGFGAVEEQAAGEFDQEQHPGYRWTYRLLDVPMPDFAQMMTALSGQVEEGAEEEAASNEGLLAGPLAQIGKVWEQALRELHVEVKWKEGTHDRSFELVTHLVAQDATGQLQALIGSLSGGSSSEEGETN